MKPIWLTKQAAQTNSMDIYIYDDVKADGHDWWTGETIESETSAKYVKSQLEAARDIKNINIYINSYGGDVKEGLAIYNQLKRHQAYKTVYIDGFACSIASVIAMAADKIIMGPNTLMMIHHAWTWACGNAEELRKSANDVEIIDSASCQSYLEKAGDKLSEEKLKELLDNQTWLNAQQALEIGLCDEIAVNSKEDIEEANQRLEQAKQTEFNKYMASMQPPVAKLMPTQPIVQDNNETEKPKTNGEKIKALFKNKNLEGK